MKIAVVGCGIAGATSAFLLAEYGHDVTLIEQAAQCGPVGAGILLQPAGQVILDQLGLLEATKETSATIGSLHAQHRTGRTLVHLDYQRLRNNCHGLGVHRGELFERLFDRCLGEGVTVREGISVHAYKQGDHTVQLLNTSGEKLGEFDLVVAADGSRSRLRTHSGLVRKIVEYPYAALWLTGPWSGDDTRLLQIIDPSGRLVGVLPIGNGRASFFWGLWQRERDAVFDSGVNSWKDQVADFFADAAEITAPVASMNEVTYATYRNVEMRSHVDGRMVFIGDAAHAMSPHLGQGTNLALVDALCLSQQIADTDDIHAALSAYNTSRRRLVNYYSRLTALLTPYFQTDNRLLQFGRDLALPVMPKLPFVGREMLRTLAGEKQGWLG